VPNEIEPMTPEQKDLARFETMRDALHGLGCPEQYITLDDIRGRFVYDRLAVVDEESGQHVRVIDKNGNAVTRRVTGTNELEPIPVAEWIRLQFNSNKRLAWRQAAL
jgi:hypothetical protein